MSRRSNRRSTVTVKTDTVKKRKHPSSQDDGTMIPPAKLAKKDVENKDISDLQNRERIFVQKKYDFLVGKAIGFNDLKGQPFEPSLNRLVWIPEQTEGQGDCLLHALFGNKKETERLIICDEIDSLRKTMQEKILEIADKVDNSLRDLVIEGISALIMEEKEIKNSSLIKSRPHMARLLQEYCDWEKQDREASLGRWQTFEIELKKYPKILEFIENHHLSRKKAGELDLKEKFHNALTDRDRDDQLRTMIRSEALLEKAYNEYNKKEDFNWKLKSSTDNEIIIEYAYFVGKRGQSLSPCEMKIVALIFKLNVKFRSDETANPVSHEYGGTKDFIFVRFTGHGYYGHYERCESLLLPEENQQLDVLGQITALELEAFFLKRSIAGITMLLLKLASSLLKRYQASKSSQLRLDQASNGFKELKDEVGRLYRNDEFTDEFTTRAGLLSQKKQTLQTCEAEVKEQRTRASVKYKLILALQEKYIKFLMLLPTMELKLAKNRQKIDQLIDSTIFSQNSGNEEKLFLLMDFHKPEYKDIYGALEEGDISAVKFFMKKEIKKSGSFYKCPKSDRNTTPLQEAIFYGYYNPEIVSLFLEQKNIVFPSELMEAAYKGNIETLARIYQASSLEEADEHGCRALHYAATAGQKEAVIWLDRAGFDVRVKEQVQGSSPWLLAAGSGHLPILKYFYEEKKQEQTVQRMLLEEKDHSENTAFLLAARCGHTAIVEWFLELKVVNINEADNELMTATHLAVYYHHLPTLKKILEYKPDLSKEENNGNTPLMLAAFRGNLAMVKLLFDLDKSSVAKQNRTNCNILHLTLAYNQIPEIVKLAIIRFLVKNGGALLKARDKDGYTPLLIAINNGYYNIVKFLLEVDKDQEPLIDKYGEDYENIMDLLMNKLKHVDIAVLLLKTDPVLKEKYDSEVLLFPYSTAKFHLQAQTQLKSTQRNNLVDDDTLTFLEQITLAISSKKNLILSSSQGKNLRDLQSYEQDLRILNKQQTECELQKKQLDTLVNYPTIVAEIKRDISQALEKEDFQTAKNLSESVLCLQIEYNKHKSKNIQQELHKVEEKLVQIKDQRLNLSDNRLALLVTIKSAYVKPKQVKFVSEVEEMKSNFRT